jgi:16S rRNA (cytosine1402-N4)-methyltransferase
VNGWDESDLADVLFNFGEEHDSRRIARTIVRARPIRSTEHLATVVAGARFHGGRQKLHPATKTFLALRIAVNRELEALEQFLLRTPATLNSEGRMVVMSYHSLEDRRVKYFFREQAAAGVLQIVTKKAVQATDDEINRNHRARSVKLRAAEKMAGVQ